MLPQISPLTINMKSRNYANLFSSNPCNIGSNTMNSASQCYDGSLQLKTKWDHRNQMSCLDFDSSCDFNSMAVSNDSRSISLHMSDPSFHSSFNSDLMSHSMSSFRSMCSTPSLKFLFNLDSDYGQNGYWCISSITIQGGTGHVLSLAVTTRRNCESVLYSGSYEGRLQKKYLLQTLETPEILTHWNFLWYFNHKIDNPICNKISYQGDIFFPFFSKEGNSVIQS